MIIIEIKQYFLSKIRSQKNIPSGFSIFLSRVPHWKIDSPMQKKQNIPGEMNVQTVIFKIEVFRVRICP